MSKKTTLRPEGFRDKPLGLIWLYSQDPILCLGFEQVLGHEADFHFGDEPPAGREVSCVVCPYGTKVGPNLKRLRNLAPETPVIVYGLDADPELAGVGIFGGASGYIHAGMGVTRMVQTISLASNGLSVIPEGASRKPDRIPG